MAGKKPHHLVDFASRYSAWRFPTLDAYSALWRAEALVDDAERLLDLRERCRSADISFGLWNTYEIISYFAVGLVTCLEWHARSRLVDLLLFRPDCIDTSDVKNIDKIALSQMMSEGVTVPYLLGAVTKVSSIQEYVRVFERIFKALEIEADAETLIREAQLKIEGGDSELAESLYTVIDQLFEYRNHLVHEIDLSVIGHFSIRDMWKLERSIRYGKVVVFCIKLLEAQITQHASRRFPNRLDASGYPEDEYEKITEEILALEAALSSSLETPEMDGARAWAEALKASRASSEKELQFLQKADFLRPIRHLDSRRLMQVEYLKTRLAYLSLLKSALDRNSSD